MVELFPGRPGYCGNLTHGRVKIHRGLDDPEAKSRHNARNRQKALADARYLFTDRLELIADGLKLLLRNRTEGLHFLLQRLQILLGSNDLAPQLGLLFIRKILLSSKAQRLLLLPELLVGRRDLIRQLTLFLPKQLSVARINLQKLVDVPQLALCLADGLINATKGFL